MIGIYKITNPIGEVYIGQSKDINRRFLDYKRFTSLNIQKKLAKSFFYYGYLNHSFEILTECKPNELNNFENFYQLKYNSIQTGLNSILKFPDSDEQKTIKNNKSLIDYDIYEKYYDLFSPRGKRIIDLSDGTIYNSFEELSKRYRIKKSILYNKVKRESDNSVFRTIF